MDTPSLQGHDSASDLTISPSGTPLADFDQDSVALSEDEGPEAAPSNAPSSLGYHGGHPHARVWTQGPPSFASSEALEDDGELSVARGFHPGPSGSVPGTRLEAAQYCVNGTIASLPSALFDLPDLTGVLNLNTWHQDLNEGEREHLRQFLPDGVGEGAGEHLEAVLDGTTNIYFGNPTNLLWQQLRSGECHPQVAADRAVLRGLRRQAAEAEAASHFDMAIARLLSLSLATQIMPDSPLPDVLEVWRAALYCPPATPEPVAGPQAPKRRKQGVLLAAKAAGPSAHFPAPSPQGGAPWRPIPAVNTGVLDDQRMAMIEQTKKCIATIRESTLDERLRYRAIERERYACPWLPWIWPAIGGGVEGVVAPIKRTGLSSNAKAREHSILKGDRPYSVSILSLVRDAASRLPGGAGTRSDFVLLLYDSQYVIEGLPEKDVILSVSGALDRLQHETGGAGPCVEYDASRKVWVYLHATRRPEDFETVQPPPPPKGKPRQGRAKGALPPPLHPEATPTPSGDATVQQHDVGTAASHSHGHTPRPLLSPRSTSLANGAGGPSAISNGAQKRGVAPGTIAPYGIEVQNGSPRDAVHGFVAQSTRDDQANGESPRSFGRGFDAQDTRSSGAMPGGFGGVWGYPNGEGARGVSPGNPLGQKLPEKPRPNSGPRAEPQARLTSDGPADISVASGQGTRAHASPYDDAYREGHHLPDPGNMFRAGAPSGNIQAKPSLDPAGVHMGHMAHVYANSPARHGDDPWGKPTPGSGVLQQPAVGLQSTPGKGHGHTPAQPALYPQESPYAATGARGADPGQMQRPMFAHGHPHMAAGGPMRTHGGHPLSPGGTHAHQRAHPYAHGNNAAAGGPRPAGVGRERGLGPENGPWPSPLRPAPGPGVRGQAHGVAGYGHVDMGGPGIGGQAHGGAGYGQVGTGGPGSGDAPSDSETESESPGGRARAAAAARKGPFGATWGSRGSLSSLNPAASSE